MSGIDIFELRRLVASFPSEPGRTIALEQRIQIGAGFHDKWYGSQREHWLGWLSLKVRENELDGKAFQPSKIWSGLKCSPMMFWLAEVAGVDSKILGQLEAASVAAAKIRPKDGNPHGVEFRRILPWSEVNALLTNCAPQRTTAEADQIGNDAIRKLIAHLPTYQKYLPHMKGD
ncbi:hypothetical protein [Parasedimentitalea huanghaiensis]|uniref:Uncharacterized protein n=1 Tax=Parasedimentitalea huanghaiensis TaxID=2682100 RepID=A0A6L6WRN4_9RHOB|nr:hypothetical protein [Zongyanglinia huanghaiensis]MVO18597.1 hypothetical protein [Zongyanglinia huanghaiensis]